MSSRKIKPNERETTRATRTYAGDTSNVRQARRRVRMLEAATALIGTHGFGSATVRAVCRESGLSQRYYYECFDNAEAMLVHVYEMQLDRIEKAVLDAWQTAPKEERLRDCTRAFFELIRTEPHVGRIVLLEILGISVTVDQAYRRGTERFVTVAAALIKPSLASHPTLDPELIAQFAIGAIVSAATHWMLADYTRDLDQIIENMMYVFGALTDP